MALSRTHMQWFLYFSPDFTELAHRTEEEKAFSCFRQFSPVELLTLAQQDTAAPLACLRCGDLSETLVLISNPSLLARVILWTIGMHKDSPAMDVAQALWDYADLMTNAPNEIIMPRKDVAM